MKLNKSKILALGFLAMLFVSCQIAEGMFGAALACNKPATQEQIRQAKSCPICLEELTEHDNLSALHCDPKVPHIFHKECLNGWIREGKIKCPVCRSPISARLVRENLSVRVENRNMVQENPQVPATRNQIKDYTKTLGILALDAASIFAGYKLYSKLDPSWGFKICGGFLGFIFMQNFLDIFKSRDPEANRRELNAIINARLRR